MKLSGLFTTLTIEPILCQFEPFYDKVCQPTGSRTVAVWLWKYCPQHRLISGCSERLAINVCVLFLDLYCPKMFANLFNSLKFFFNSIFVTLVTSRVMVRIFYFHTHSAKKNPVCIIFISMENSLYWTGLCFYVICSVFGALCYTLGAVFGVLLHILCHVTSHQNRTPQNVWCNTNPGHQSMAHLTINYSCPRCCLLLCYVEVIFSYSEILLTNRTALKLYWYPTRWFSGEEF